MPELVFPLDSTKKLHRAADRRPQPLAPRHPGPGARQAGRHVPGALPRVVRRRHPQRRLRRRHPERPAGRRARAVRARSRVEGAQPGDLLIVDILDVGPIPQEDSGPLAGQGWGYTGVFATRNGGGFLTEQFPDAYKVIWDFQGGMATSRHVPGVSFTGIVHPGLMGTAPSAELLSTWNAREQALIDTDPDRVPPLALPPLPGLGDPGQPHRRRLRPGRRRGRAHRAAAGERRQPGHQEPDQGLAGLLPGVRRRREALDGRPALLPGRRRDHLLRRDRDGRVHGPARRPDQGRHGHLRRLRERDLHAGHTRPAVQRVAGVLRHLGDARRRAALPRLAPVATSGPACTRSTTCRSSATATSRRT